MSLETWRYGICWGEDPTRRGVVQRKSATSWIQAGEMKCRMNQVVPLGPDNALTAAEREELTKEVEKWRDVQDLVDVQVVVAACDGTSVSNVYVDKDGVQRRQFEIYALPGGGVGARNCVCGIENVLSDSQVHFPKAKIVHALKTHCGYYSAKTAMADEHIVRLSALVGKQLRQGIPGGSSTKAPAKKKKAPPKKKVSYAAPAPEPVTSPEADDCLTACKYGSARKLKEFLDAGWEDSYDLNRALCQAAWLGRTDMIRMLLDHGVKADANADGDRMSPLCGRGVLPSISAAMASYSRNSTRRFFAAAEGRVDAAKMLIDAGADACFVGDKGFSPLMVAAKLGHTEVARLLISKGADVEGSSTVAEIRAEMEAEEEEKRRAAEAAEQQRQIETAKATVLAAAAAAAPPEQTAPPVPAWPEPTAMEEAEPVPEPAAAAPEPMAMETEPVEEPVGEQS